MQCVHGLVIYIVRRRLNPCITKPSLCIHHRYDPSDDETSDPEEPDHSDSDTEEANAKEFRFNAKNLGLTYSQCPLELRDLVDAFHDLNNDRKLGVTKLIIGQEEHNTNGGRHFHVYLHFAKKFGTRNARYFDINDNETKRTYHPNWKKFPKEKSAVKKWMYYCMKEGKKHIEGFMPNLFIFKDATNYTKNKADHEAWMRDAEDQGLENPFPFNLPDGFQITEPSLSYRKRHWLILGPPDCGKTYWATRAFKNKRVFARGSAKSNFHYEAAAYHQEKVIIWDDIVPKINEVIEVSNGASGFRKMTYGSSRYTNNYWKQEQATVIIWLLNPSRLPDWAKPWHKDYYIFSTRFNIMAYENGEWVDRDATLDLPPQQPGVWVNPGV